MDEVQRVIIEETVKRTGDKKTAAHLLGIGLRTVYRKL